MSSIRTKRCPLCPKVYDKEQNFPNLVLYKAKVTWHMCGLTSVRIVFNGCPFYTKKEVTSFWKLLLQ